MSDTVTRCTCTAAPGSCSASAAEHVRAAAEFVLSLGGHYDEVTCRCPGHLAEIDQSAAIYRAVLKLQGVEGSDLRAVGVFAVATATLLGSLAIVPGAGLTVFATAKLVTLALPVLEELARG